MSDTSDRSEIGAALSGLRGGPGRAVLIVEANPDQQARLARLVTVRGHRAIGTSSLDGARALMKAFPVDLVLLAHEVVGESALVVVAEFVGARPHARVVIMTPPSTSGLAPSLKALEHIPRPFTGDLLSSLLAGAPLPS